MSDFIVKIAAVLIALLSPVVPILLVVLLFIVVDFATGVYASKVKKRKIKSSGFRKTVEKFVLYCGAVLLARCFDFGVTDAFYVTQCVGGFIAATELLSIFENISAITGIPIGERLKSVLSSVLGGIFKKRAEK